MSKSKNMKKRLACSLLLLVAVLLISSCDPYSRLIKKRAEKAERTGGDIVVGLVFGSWEPLAIRGCQLAVEELNKKGVIGRQIKTIVYHNKGSLPEGLEVARKLAANDEVIAVIGHGSSDVAIPASIVYQRRGIVFISHGATNPALTRYNFNYVFRNIPSDREFGDQMARFAYVRGYKRMVLLVEKSIYGEGLGRVLHEGAKSLGIEIVAMRSYFQNVSDFRLLISEFANKNFDAIFLTGVLPAAALIIKQSRSMGINTPFIGGDGLDDPSLREIAGKAAEGTVVPTVFNIDYPGGATQDFVERFKSRFSETPDTAAAQGYDAVKVLAHAIEKGQSAIPLVISSNLRFIRDWDAVTSSYSFTQNGDSVHSKIFYKIFRNGKFVPLEH